MGRAADHVVLRSSRIVSIHTARSSAPLFRIGTPTLPLLSAERRPRGLQNGQFAHPIYYRRGTVGRR